MNKPFVKILIRAVPYIFYAVLAVFLVIYLQSIDYSKFADITVDWFYVAIASVLGIVVRYWGGYVWYVILNQLSKARIKQFTELMYVYAQAWMARYIPGTAAWIVSRVYFASKYGISKNKLAVSSLLESGLQVTVVMASALVMLMIDDRFILVGSDQKVLMFIALIACIIALIPRVFNFIVSKVYKVIKRKSFDTEHYIDGRTVLNGSWLYLIWSLIGGLSLFFISKAVYPELGYDTLLFVMGVSNLAGALSMLAIFAPSGLGVREGIQIALLSIIMPTEYALVIAIVMRLWSILLDFIFFGMAWLHKRLKKLS